MSSTRRLNADRCLRVVMRTAAVLAAFHCFAAEPPADESDSAPVAATRSFEVVVQLGTVLNEPGAFDGYTLFAKHRGAYLIDNAGQLRHKWDLPEGAIQVKLMSNGNLLMRSSDRLFELDADGDEIWRTKAAPGARIHHDYLRLHNGNILLLLRSSKDKPELVAAGADPQFAPERLFYSHLVEVVPTPPEGGEVARRSSRARSPVPVAPGRGRPPGRSPPLGRSARLRPC